LQHLAEPAGSRHRLAYLIGAVALIASALLMIAGRAKADLVYWVNNESVAYSQLDGKAGGFLPASVNAIHNGQGTAIDTANSRIYVAQEATNEIVWFSLDGFSRGVVNTPPGSVDHPTNVSIDPETQILYWANDDNPGSIGYAYTNESGGGTFVKPGTTGASVAEPSRLAVDTLNQRVYWWNEGSEVFSWVAMGGAIGGNLSTSGLAFGEPGLMGGIAVEPYSTPEEIYFMDNEVQGIFHTDPLLGGAPEEVQGAVKNNVAEPIGLAFDGTDDKFFWANHEVDEGPDEAIGTATLFGQPNTIQVFPVAPIHNPVFASVLKAPAPSGPPQLALVDKTMSCTVGEWEEDRPGASVYVAPTSFRYQWRKGSTPIAEATTNTFTATESGTYSCMVIGVNAAGETGNVSKSTTLTFPAAPKTTTPSTPKPKTEPKPKEEPAPKTATVVAKLASTKPVKAKAGGSAAIKVDLANTGNATSSSVKVCGKLTRQAKKGLKAPACVTVRSVAAGKTVVASLTAKTLPAAHGTYKLTVSVTGATTASMTAKVQVARARHR
jgi:hypothetical protein